MTVQEWLQSATEKLRNAGVEMPRLDVIVLLEDIIGLNRANLLAHPEMVLEESKLALLNTKIVQREQHIPLAYIRGHAEFYGRKFTVNNAVLVPRPETESIIAIVKKLPLKGGIKLADIGTGSGCIGITAALELGAKNIHLYDISQTALDAAKDNAATYNVSAEYYLEDLIATPHDTYDVVFANLPYVPENGFVNKATSFEPRIALYSGDDGLDLFRRFWKEVTNLGDKPSYIITESRPEQHTELTGFAKTAGYYLVDTDNFVQAFALTD